MENKVPTKILVLILNDDKKIMGKIKELNPMPICKTDSSCSIEKINTPLKDNATMKPIRNLFFILGHIIF
jgi:hypothetical protein